MKDKFSEFYEPEIWDDCIFIFDTNVFIDLYYKKNVFNTFIEILDQFPDRIWMPHQVGWEYHIHRVDIIEGRVKAYNQFISDYKGLAKGIRSKTDKLKEYDHYINISEHIDLNKLDEYILQLEDIDIESIIDPEANFFSDDKICNKLNELFEGKVGDEYPDDVLQEIYEEGKEREKDETPPGLKDSNYGDLLIWKQIIDFAKDKTNIIFVTSEKKKDWWFKKSSNIEIPHPLLLKEFSKETNKKIYIYKFSEFLKMAKPDIDPETIESIEEIDEITSDYLTYHDLRDLQQVTMGIDHVALRDLQQAATGIDHVALRDLQQAATGIDHVALRDLQQAAMGIDPEFFREIRRVADTGIDPDVLRDIQRATSIDPKFKKELYRAIRVYPKLLRDIQRATSFDSELLRLIRHAARGVDPEVLRDSLGATKTDPKLLRHPKKTQKEDNDSSDENDG